MSTSRAGRPAAMLALNDENYPLPISLPVRLDSQLCFAVYAASRSLTNSYRELLKDLGLTYPQYIVLVALWECDRVAVSDLCARVMLDFGTLTPLLKRLELRGLITRKRNPRDERQIILSVTKTGRSMQNRAADVPGKLRCQITLSRAQTLDLRSSLKQIVLDLREDKHHGSALLDQG